MTDAVVHTAERCDTCKFMWPVEKDAEVIYHECRCHAPQLASSNQGWPKVKVDDWCGEYVALVGA